MMACMSTFYAPPSGEVFLQHFTKTTPLLLDIGQLALGDQEIGQ